VNHFLVGTGDFFFVKASRLVVGSPQPPLMVGTRSASLGSKVAGACS
jgi:hypothetical protein